MAGIIESLRPLLQCAHEKGIIMVILRQQIASGGAVAQKSCSMAAWSFLLLLILTAMAMERAATLAKKMRFIYNILSVKLINTITGKPRAELLL